MRGRLIFFQNPIRSINKCEYLHEIDFYDSNIVHCFLLSLFYFWNHELYVFLFPSYDITVGCM